MRRAEERTGGRAGVSAPEAIVALLLGLLVVHMGLSTLARLRTTQLRLASRTDGLVAMRAAPHILRRELRDAVPGDDWSQDGDSLSLRAFRGTALVCPYAGPADELTVTFRGDRRPDPTKDSVVLLDGVGGRVVRALTAVTSGSGSGCMAADSAAPLETWRLDAAVPPASVVARLFERGSYHLSAAALRYRRGASGRQPLTPEVWSDSTGWRSGGGRLGLEALPRDPSSGGLWSTFLTWSARP